MAESQDVKRKERPPPDKYRVSIIIDERNEARPLVRDQGLDLVQTEILEGGKRFRLSFFLNEEEIKNLRESGYSPEVGENVSEIGLKRQTEVAKGDRFEGGSVAPEGLGVKRGREQNRPK